MWVWDYNIKNNWQPTTDQEREWFLVRKINYGDFKGVKKDMLKKHFQQIQYRLDPGKRAMIENFFHQKIFDRHEFLFENKEVLRLEFVHYNHEKKTLGKKELLLGVQIDSLVDIAANKTFAYFDRNEPKDLFDVYFLLQKGGFTPIKLLSLVEQKFGVSFDESSFWSEAFKSFPLLYTLRPLLLQKGNEKQEDLLKNIEDYFKEGSRAFLKRNLE
ncbi:MAG: nucleotidyl transferase AbiEii/AbiGii toxin family protein [Candidatus Levybacteria bacterium]|nr:nucleotidyl transferase AbiEii/AbiGii toxin family protein [Candidatus Levybacteria bacterium]